MKLHSKKPELFAEISTYISTYIRIIINLLLIIIGIALAIGIIKAGYDLFTDISQPADVVLPQLLVDTVFIVALVEISLLLLGYLKDGHVHVRYIVDTVLIIMLNEFVVLWFNQAEPLRLLVLSAVVATLVASRIFVIRFGSEKD